MAINIVDLVKGYATNEIVSKASSFLGESEGGVSKAVSGLIPSLLGGLMGKATASEAGAEEIFQSAKAANDGGFLGNLGSLFGNADILSKGTSLFSSLFGGKSNSIIDAISSFADWLFFCALATWFTIVQSSLFAWLIKPSILLLTSKSNVN